VGTINPPFFPGTVWVTPNVITADDPTSFLELKFNGKGVRTVYDRRIGWDTKEVFLYSAIYSDRSPVEFQINTELPNIAENLKLYTDIGLAIGRLPLGLHTNLQTVWIHDGDYAAGGGNNNVLLHKDYALRVIKNGFLEEVLLHEASHTSLDWAWKGLISEQSWNSAQNLDLGYISQYAQEYPDREDVAELFPIYYVIRNKPTIFSSELAVEIERSQKNRFAVYDSLSVDLTPVGPPRLVSSLNLVSAELKSVSSDLILVFSEFIARGNGTLVLTDSLGTVIESFNVSTSSAVSLYGTSLTVNPSSNLAYSTRYRLEIPAGAIKDTAGNSQSEAVTFNFVTVAGITIAITSNKTSLKAGETALITFALSESSLDFTASDVSVIGGTLSNFTGSGTNYTATFTPTANSTTNGVVSIASGKFSDAAGNFNADGADANNNVTVTISTIVPQKGTTGADFLTGSNGNDTIDGLAGNDTLTGGSGDDRLDGGAGIDQAIYTGTRSDYQLVKKADSNWAVTDQRVFAQVVGGPQGDGNDQVVSMERLKFSDKSIAIDLDGNAGNAARTLATVFGKDALKKPIYAGMAIDLFDQGYTKDQVSQVLLDAVLGTKPQGANIVSLLEKNLTDKNNSSGTAAELSRLFDSFNAGTITSAQLVSNAASIELASQVGELAALSKAGWEYIPMKTKSHGSYADLPDTLYQFFVVGFGAAAGVTYMDQMAEAYRYWLPEYKEGTVKQIVEVFTTKTQFTSVYPQALYREDQGKYYRYDHDLSLPGKPLVRGPEVSKATYDEQMADLAQELINLIVKQSASTVAKAQAVEDVKSALGLGGEWTIGKVVYTVFGNLANKPADDPDWAGTAQQFANQVAVSKYYTDILSQSTDDITTLRSVMTAVTNTTDVSSNDAIASLIGVALLNGPGI